MDARFSPYKQGLFYIGVTVLYFFAGKLGLSLAIVNPSASAVWPPTGIALTVLLGWGTRMWPTVFIGAFFVNLSTSGGVWPSLFIAGGNTLEAITATYLVQRFAHGRQTFEQSNDVFKFVVLAAGLSTMVSATIGTTTLVLSHLAERASYSTIWLTWWQGDAMGCLLFTPLLLLWGFTPPGVAWNRLQKFEAPLLLVVGSLFALAGFCGWYTSITLTSFLRVSCIPLILWAAFRFGPREAATMSVVICAIALWGTLNGLGPFAQERLPNDALLRLQMYMGVVTIMSISIAVEVAERKRAAQALIKANEYLELRVQERTASLKEAIQALQNQMSARSEAEDRFRKVLESNIIGFMIVDMEGKVLDANDAFLNAIGYTRDELYAGQVGGNKLTPPEYHTMDEWVRVRLNEAGYCSPFEKEYIRKDGSRWPVLVGVVRLDKPEPHCVCFVIDVTERRKAQGALQSAYDELEKRIAERTAELVNTNATLEKEVLLRTQAEEQLLELSLRDPLTGLYNRRGFMTLAEQHLLGALRDKREFLFFYADIDGLKQINDELGHVRGDQAIIKAAEILRETFRKSDIIARVGGDEFAILATQAGPTEKAPYFTRMQKRLEHINAENHFPFVLSMSIGAAIFDLKSMSSLQELMSRADEDLYQRKRALHSTGFRVIRAA